MGNTSSQSMTINQPPSGWTNSYPRDAHKAKLRKVSTPENKVLPERIPGQKLKLTSNGAILQQGGTISGKRSLLEPEVEATTHTIIEESPSKQKIRSRKKYKAPPPPPEDSPTSGIHSSTLPRDLDRLPERPRSGAGVHDGDFLDSPGEGQHGGKENRRMRLFKTKAEAKKSSSGKVTEEKVSSNSEYKQRSKSEERHYQKIRRSDDLRYRAKSMDSIHAELQRRFSQKSDRTAGHSRSSDGLHPPQEEGSSSGGSKRSSRLDAYRGGGVESSWSPADGPRASPDGQDGAAITSSLQNLVISATHRQPPLPSFLEIYKSESPNKQGEVSTLERNKMSPQNEDKLKNHPPKTFYFGMEPKELSVSTPERNKKRSSEIRITGKTVEYHRREGSIGEVRREQRQYHRSLSRDASCEKRSYDSEKRRSSKTRTNDYLHTRSLERTRTSEKRDLAKDIDEFKAVIEKEKLRREVSSTAESLDLDRTSHSREDSTSCRTSQRGSSNNSDGDINLRLKPTLPKKQLEIPRFSPTAAWRSLSLDHLVAGGPEDSERSHSSEEGDILEDRIERRTRPVAPPRVSNEKSGDSGISGDAGSPGPIHDFDSVTPPEKFKKIIASPPLAVSSPIPSTARNAEMLKKQMWTPEQDLEGTSIDGSSENSPSVRRNRLQRPNSSHDVPLSPGPPKLTSRSNMFVASPRSATPDSLGGDVSPPEKKASSRPRWKKRVPGAEPGVPYTFNSLRKLKRSVSGAFGGLGNKGRSEEGQRDFGENWYLSRSAPNSLNNGEEFVEQAPSSLSKRFDAEIVASSREVKSDLGISPNSRRLTYYTPNSHVMYLPHYDTTKPLNNGSFDYMDVYRNDYFHSDVNRRSISAERFSGELQHNSLPFDGHRRGRSRTPNGYDVRSQTPDYHPRPTTPQQPSSSNPLEAQQEPNKVLRKKKGKKFTFESTVRLSEKKKLEEKLSKEAEVMEHQRLQEKEAMKKVEEEFQRKRAGEKANIRHQLRLLSLGKNNKQQTEPVKKPDTSHVGKWEVYRDYREEGNVSFSSIEDTSEMEKNKKNLDTSKQPPPPPPPTTPPPVITPDDYLPPLHIPPQEFSPPSAESPQSSTQTSSSMETPQKEHSGFFNGITKWMRGKNRNSSSDTPSTLSPTRQEPDGAPAPDNRKVTDELSRSDIIAASKNRSGDLQSHEELVRPSAPERKKSIYKHLSEVAEREEEEVRKNNEERGERKLTQELSEYKEERREYREYRSHGQMDKGIRTHFPRFVDSTFEIPSGPSSTPSGHSYTPVNTPHPQTPTNRSHTPTNRSHTPTNRSHTPTNRSHTPTNRSHTPTNRSHTPTNRSHTPIHMGAPTSHPYTGSPPSVPRMPQQKVLTPQEVQHLTDVRQSPAPVSDNYRLDFALGGVPTPHRSSGGESDALTPQQSDAETPKRSRRKKNQRLDEDSHHTTNMEEVVQPTSRVYQTQVHMIPPMPPQQHRGKGYPVVGMMERYHYNAVQPFLPNKRYRPVPFSPNVAQKMAAPFSPNVAQKMAAPVT